jgi:demethylmenaquinone methyltransferase/2-methoxy-6-polyprenyl-1,4-benzoquinol methylase
MADLFDLVARWYDRIFRFMDNRPLVGLLQLEPGQRLLDVGGGTGRVTGTFDGVEVIICDPSAGMTREAQRKGLTTCRCRAEVLPFEDGAFDAVLVVDAFHHFNDQRRAAQEMLRVLRPGGRLVLEEPDIRRPSVRLIALGERLLRMNSRFFTLQEITTLFEATGGQTIATDEGVNVSVRLVIMHQGVHK